MVASLDAQCSILPQGAVVIHGREIVGVGEAEALLAGCTMREKRDCRGWAIIPSLTFDTTLLSP
jgi:hypothetical protein